MFTITIAALATIRHMSQQIASLKRENDRLVQTLKEKDEEIAALAAEIREKDAIIEMADEIITGMDCEHEKIAIEQHHEEQQSEITFEDFIGYLEQDVDSMMIICENRYTPRRVFNQIKEEYPIMTKDFFVPDVDWHPAIAIMDAIEALDRPLRMLEEDELPW